MKKILTYIPLEIRIKYGAWRLFALIGMIVLLLIILLIPAYLFLKKICFTVVVNDREEQSICLNALKSYDVYTEDSENLGFIKKGVSGALSFTFSKFTVTPSKTVNLTEGLPVSVEIEDEADGDAADSEPAEEQGRSIEARDGSGEATDD